MGHEKFRCRSPQFTHFLNTQKTGSLSLSVANTSYVKTQRNFPEKLQFPSCVIELNYYRTIMAEVADVKTCSNPGCDLPGTSSCGACKTTPYCGPICQTADWPHHKEECQGHLRKVGTANVAKAKRFDREHNWVQALRYGEIAATKLKQLKDRSLETVQDIDSALGCKFDALQRLDRHREALECVKECYTLWAMNHMRNPGSIYAALHLIQSCLHNEEYEDAEHYARHAMFMINDMTDNFIPSEQRPQFLARGSYLLAVAIFHLAKAGGIPSEEKQKAGEEAIAFARQALEIHTQLHGTESIRVAIDLGALANALDHFNGVDDDEVLRLLEQAIAIYRRVEGNTSVNVAVHENMLGAVYYSRGYRAWVANDADRCIVNLELALPRYREASRIFRVNCNMNRAEGVLLNITTAEKRLQEARIARDRSASAAATKS